MNLEEELNLINNQNLTEGEMTQPVFEPTPAVQPNMFQNNMQPTFQNNVQQPPVFQAEIPSIVQNTMPTAQPSMVNPATAQAETNAYSFSNLDFDPNKPLYDRNPLERLSGNPGEIFRIHFLPGVSTKKVHNHYNAELQQNFVCLKDVYGTQHEDCCRVYGESKPRVIIPVVVMPIITGQPNNLMQGQPAKLSTLVLGPSQFIKLQDQAKFAGVELTQCDIIAAVDNPRFKSFNFTIAQNTFISQIPNIGELTASWNQLATPENICKLAGRLIDRTTYSQAYANYDKSKYEQPKNTPTQGQLNVDPNMLAFNNPNPQMAPFGPGYGSPSSPMYSQAPYTPTQTAGNQNPFAAGQGYSSGTIGNDNPWGNFGA